MGCGHVYLSALDGDPAGVDYWDFKQSYRDEELLNPDSPLMRVAVRRAELLLQTLPAVKSLFEIGFGYGHFLHAIGPTCLRTGVEVSRDGPRFASEYFNLTGLQRGSVEQVDFKCQLGTYDAICAFHVLEHLVDPFSLVVRCRQALGESGVLCAAVPVLETLSADLTELYFLYRRWHLHTFSIETFENMLGCAGYAVSTTEHESRTKVESSLFVIASKGVTLTRNPRPDLAQDNLSKLRDFHQRINFGISKVRAAFDKWFQKGSSVAIYGAGIHTVALIELCELPVENILCLIDDDPAKEDSTLKGIQVRSLSAATASEPDIILVSTLASEQRLLELLSSAIPNSTQVLGVYKDFFK